MKKYLLTALLGVFGFVGAFVSAETLTFTSNENFEYSPSSFTTDGGVINLINFTCDQDDASCYFRVVGKCTYGYNVRGDEPYWESTCDGYELPAGTYTVDNDEDVSFNSIKFSVGTPSSEGGDINEGDNNGSLLPGGEGDLSLIISGLSDTINEFIPYLVYLGLGIITALIGFVAIKWLINRTSSKVRGTFKSGRRRR